MKRQYSRLATIEERRNIRRAVLFIVLAVGGILGMLFFGLPTLANFASFLSDLKKGSSPIESTDTTPPAPPSIETLPESTNKLRVDLKGRSEAGATIIISFNGKDDEVLADAGGDFSYTLELDKGDNNLYLIAKDGAGNESVKTDAQVIVYDNEEPTIEVSEPEDGKEFFGISQRQISIKGSVDEGSNLTINERVVKVEGNGSFNFTTSLSEGDNIFTLKAEDKAINTSEKSLTIRFTP